MKKHGYPWLDKARAARELRRWTNRDITKALEDAGTPLTYEYVKQVMGGTTRSESAMKKIGAVLDVPPEL